MIDLVGEYKKISKAELSKIQEQIVLEGKPLKQENTQPRYKTGGLSKITDQGVLGRIVR